MSNSNERDDDGDEPRDGESHLADALVPLVYAELRRIAHRQLSGRDGRRTIETTGLVHEAYLRLVDQAGSSFNDRAHFLAVASLAMRNLLVDRARARAALKRGGEQRRITLDEQSIAVDEQADALLQLHEALEAMAKLEPRLARVVQCRFFGGMTEEEIATALDVTVRTVQRDWTKARVLLRHALSSEA